MIFLKTTAAILIVLCAATAGSSVSARLKMREKELSIFLEALFALKNAAAYTAGDLYALLSLCRENAFLGRVWVLSENMDCTAAFKAAAHALKAAVAPLKEGEVLSTKGVL